MSSAVSPSGQSKKSRSPQAAAVMLTAAVLVLAPVIVKEAPREKARWYYAAALEYRDHDQRDAAMSALKEALQLDPEQPDYYLMRAEMLKEQGEASLSALEKALKLDQQPGYHRQRAKMLLGKEEIQQCIEDLVQAVKVSPRDRVYDVYLQRAEFLQELSLWEDAVDDWKQLVRLFEDPQLAARFPARLQLHVLQNGLAYSRALANIELDSALEDVNKALAALEDEPKDGANSQAYSQQLAHYLDTRGFVYYRKGEMTKALKDLDTSVTKLTELRAKHRERIAVARKQRINVQDLNQALRLFDHTLAVVLHHRMLVNDVLDPAAAQADAHAIQALGEDPNGGKLF